MAENVFPSPSFRKESYMVENLTSDEPIEPMTTASTRKNRFTSWSMWIAMAISLVVSIVLLVIYAVWLLNFPPAFSFSNPGAFFDSAMPVMVIICLCILLCLAFQIAKKAEWRKALGVDRFPGWRSWLRAFPVGALFVVVMAGSLYGFIGKQIAFIRNFDPNVMFECLESQMTQAGQTPPSPELRNSLPFPDKEEIEERMLYPLKYPFENGIWSGRFLSYLALCLLFALINELIFRGIGFAGYKQTGSSLRAVIITSIVNGVLFFPVGIVWAMLLGWVRVRGGSLYCSIATSMLGIVSSLAVVYFAYIAELL